MPRVAVNCDDIKHVPADVRSSAHLTGLCFLINLADAAAAN
jgi:hypothetical protein